MTTLNNDELREQLQSLSYRAVVSAYNTSEAWLVDYARELTEGLMQLIASHDQQLLEAILEGIVDEPEDDPNCAWGHDFQTGTRNERNEEIRQHIKSVFQKEGE